MTEQRLNEIAFLLEEERTHGRKGLANPLNEIAALVAEVRRLRALAREAHP
jgi:hypothetical protein